MFPLPNNQMIELCYFAFISDMEISNDLSGGYIKTENDYTSNFTGSLRRNINTYSKTGLQASSFLLAPAQERQIGCDATIIIRSGNECKVVVFEAKWPRFSKKNYKWDHAQTATGLSHFSDQLDRQAGCSRALAVFEMFYSESQPGHGLNFMQQGLSSCVWHKDAMSFRSQRSNPDSIWDQVDLQNMLQKGNYHIAEILKEVCLCHEGRPLKWMELEIMAQEFSLPSNILVINADRSEEHGLKPEKMADENNMSEKEQQELKDIMSGPWKDLQIFF